MGTTLKVALAPLQYSDSPRQKAHDVDVLMQRGYHVLMGTESGEQPLMGLVHARGRDHGYSVHLKRSNWIAVSREIVKPRSLMRGFEPVLESTDGVGHHGDRGIPWLSFEHRTPGVGRITVGCGHMLTHGRTPDDPNWVLNGTYAEEVGQWAREHGRGSDIVLYGADQNTDDEQYDTFRGEPLTSVWDELGKWPNTGHGCIDVIATADADRRVSVKSARSLNDRRVMLYGDHWLTEAEIEIRHRR